MNTTDTEHSEIAPAESASTTTSASPFTAAEDCRETAVAIAEGAAFPEVASEPVMIPVNVGQHRREDDVAVGNIRIRILRPFALARLGLPYQIWDAQKESLVTTGRKLPLRQHVKELSKRLGCGTDLVFEWVKIICEKGPENVVGDDLLKSASSGGKGGTRLGEAKEKAVTAAVYKVCVTQGLLPGSRKANKAIQAELTVAGYGSQVSNATVNQRARSPKIAVGRTDAYQRDHLMRIAGQPDETPGLNSVVVMDTTLFTDEDTDGLRVVDPQGRDMGAANVIFALLKSNRGVWSYLPFAGPQNSFLAGLAIKRGLVSKTPLLERFGIPGHWAHHGKPGTFNHDCGSEFLGSQVQGAIRRRDISIDDRSPPQTPHYRAGLERFNRTAHAMFTEFLSSDAGQRYLRSVNGRPNAKGILLNDLDKAIAEWTVGHYHTRPHKGMGGDTPFGRMEKYVRGMNGLPASGLPPAVADTEELTWDFLWEETRTVNHLGIQFMNRRYVSPELNRLLKINSRSSERKIVFRFNPYAMGQIFVKIPDQNGTEVICRIPWLPETEKYRPSNQNQQAWINPSLWEWKVIFADIRRGNTEEPTGTLAEALFAQREADAAAGKAGASGKTSKEKVGNARNRAMREAFGKENLPSTDAPSGGPVCNAAAAETKKRPQAPRLLQTGAGADLY